MNLLDLYKDPLTSNTQSPQKATHGILPPLPFCKENVQFLQKFLFLYSDLKYSEKIQLFETLIEKFNCYAAHLTDVRETSIPFRITLTPVAKLQTQRPTKISVH